MMLKHIRYLVAALALSAGSLSAYIHPCAGQWAVDVEYLYLRPSVDDTFFVINATPGTTQPLGTRENNDFEFSSGFRLGGAYAFCGCNQEFALYYTRLKTHESKTVTGTNLWATVGTPDVSGAVQNYSGFATSSNRLLYQRVDGLFGFKALCNCNYHLSVQSGFEYAYVRLNYNTDYFASVVTSANIQERSRLWGIGPQFGFQFDYLFWENNCGCLPGALSLNVVSSGSLLVSKHRVTHVEVLSSVITQVDSDDEHTWRIIPAWHARVGLNYATRISCFNTSLEVGYEFNSYNRAVARSIFPDDVSDALSITNYYNFDVQGLYIALGFGF